MTNCFQFMNLESYFYQISLVEAVLLVIFLSALAVQVYMYIYYYTGIIRHKKRVDKQTMQTNVDQLPVSVIICAKNESENLAAFLPLILEQNYPNYEVIVVNDGSTDETELLLNEFQTRYPQLYYTFMPEGTKIISRKKLALSLGIKAAKHELLLFTDADCRPLTSGWITEIVRQFTPTTEFVLGYGAYLPAKSLLSRMISYDTLFIAMQYMGFAFRGKPYMGIGRNLAYRKETFFRSKGFAGTLHIASGDDDLLVNRVATSTNTNIASVAASVTQSVPKTTFSEWYHQKERHLTTAPMYHARSKWMVAIEPISRGLFYASFLGLISFLNPLVWIVIGSLFLARYILQLVVVNKTASQLRERSFYATILLFDVILPVVTLFLMIFGRKKSFSWK